MSKTLPRWTPRLITALQTYSAHDFLSDSIAGLTVGLVALPLAMAFGISSGVTPQAGIYTAVVAGFLISALGGSRVQIGGPTGAFVVIVSGIVAKFGLSGLAIATVMAGVMLVVMGLTGLGSAVKFIPRPVVIGFTNGIAVLIASTQIKDFLGLQIDTPGEFVPRMNALLGHLDTTQWPTLLLSAGSLACILLWPRVTKRIPGSIIALFAGTALVGILGIPVETIGSRFGGIPSGLPSFSIPHFSPALMQLLLPSAITVAFLAAVESLLSAVVADGMIHDRHDSNVELVAQGIANIASPLVGGIPATGAIARTATNIRSGARSPVAGMIHALSLLGILLAAAPLARFVPLGTLAAVLFVVAYNMGEWREIPSVLRLSKADKAVWITTFALTVFADLTIAVEVGIVLAALLYIHRISETTTVVPVTPAYTEEERLHILHDRAFPESVSILKVQGPFLFGTTDKLDAATEDLGAFGSIIVLRLRHMSALDATGLHALERLAYRCRQKGKTLVLCGARAQPAQLLHQTEFVEHVGDENIVPNIPAALERVHEIRKWELCKETVEQGESFR
jgi:sulfate permease, SulP family